MSFTDPQKNLHSLGLEPGMDVADLGAGVGHYSIPAGKLVGSKGHVCAVEIQKELVEKLKNQADQEGLTHLDVIWGDLEKLGGSHLDDDTVDAVILSNILFQIKDKENLLSETMRVLRSGGKVLAIDWSESYGGLGPPDDHIVSKEEIKNLAQAIGFQITDTPAVGAHHWGLILQKQ